MLLEQQYKIVDCETEQNVIKVFDDAVKVGEVNKFLVENEVMVTGINTCEENLEDYFSELIGGGGIA